MVLNCKFVINCKNEEEYLLMKKKFESPTIETCEFVVAARLEGSSGHSNSRPNSECGMVASNGPNACVPPVGRNSGSNNSACQAR